MKSSESGGSGRFDGKPLSSTYQTYLTYQTYQTYLTYSTYPT